MVQQRLPGRAPRDAGEWAGVVEALRVVHEVTGGWRQRPGFATSRELQMIARGGDVDLAAMPPVAVARVRRAWRPVEHGPINAIHGDLGGGNVLVDEEGAVGLIDWEECRVDVAWFDFAFVPAQVPVPVPIPREQLIMAGVAWEAATCWVPEPDYAARRLNELRLRTERGRRHKAGLCGSVEVDSENTRKSSLRRRGFEHVCAGQRPFLLPNVVPLSRR